MEAQLLRLGQSGVVVAGGELVVFLILGQKGKRGWEEDASQVSGHGESSGGPSCPIPGLL